MKLRDLTGQTFGRLTVVKRAQSNTTRHGAIWECLCSCGKTKSVPSCNLLSGNTTSCGCVHREQITARNNLLALEPWLVDMNIYKRRLGYRKAKLELGSNQFKSEVSTTKHPTLTYSWGLTLEDYKELVTSPCYYCGNPPNQYPHGVLLRKTGLKRNGIDRLDNTKGYSSDNCVTCCRPCNLEKRSQTLNVFIENTRRRYTYLLSKGLLPSVVPLSLLHLHTMK
jgi:hypothetical protein